jgi:hypothetical protein
MASSFDDPFLSFYALLRRRRGAAPRPFPAHAGAWLRGNIPVQAAPGSPDSDPTNGLDAPVTAPVPNYPAYPGMAPPSPQVPAFRGLLNLGSPQPNPGFRGLLNLPIAAPDPGLGSFAADEGDLSPQFGLIGRLAALLGQNGAPNPYSPPPPDQDVPAHRGLLSQFGRGLLNVGIGGLNPSPPLPDIQRAADEGDEQNTEAVQLPDGPNNGAQSSTPEKDDELTGESAAPAVSQIPPVPVHKRDVFKSPKQQRAWADFNHALGDLPDANEVEKLAYPDIFAVEGGVIPDGSTVAGISTERLKELKNQIPSVTAKTLPKDLTPQQQVQFYRAHLDDVAQSAGGIQALEDINDPGVASYVADTLFREGKTGGPKKIQDALNKVLGAGTVNENRIFDANTLNNIKQVIQTADQRQVFMEKLYENRVVTHPSDWARNQYFYQRAFDKH